MSDLTKLTALLRANTNSETVRACLAALQSGEPMSQEGSGGPVLLKDIKNIYRVRAKINERNGSRIAGFPELLAGLERLSDDGVCIHALRFAGTEYLVFTDSQSTELAGVLQIPLATEPQVAARQPALAAMPQ